MKIRTILSAKEQIAFEKEEKGLLKLKKVIFGRWKVSILLKLDKGNKCYSDLLESLFKNNIQITAPQLNIKLKELEKDGLIEKVKSPTSHDQRDFKLTTKGKKWVTFIKMGLALTEK